MGPKCLGAEMVRGRSVCKSKESAVLAEEGREFHAEIVDRRKELAYVCARAVPCW